MVIIPIKIIPDDRYPCENHSNSDNLYENHPDSDHPHENYLDNNYIRTLLIIFAG
jgi:hypothetical protein